MDWVNVLRELVPAVAISLCFAAIIIWGVRPIVEKMLPIIDHGISVVEANSKASEKSLSILEAAMGQQQELYSHKLNDEKRERLESESAMQKRIDELVEENTQLKKEVLRIPPLEAENKRLKEELVELRKKLNGIDKKAS